MLCGISVPTLEFLIHVRNFKDIFKDRQKTDKFQFHEDEPNRFKVNLV